MSLKPEKSLYVFEYFKTSGNPDEQTVPRKHMERMLWEVKKANTDLAKNLYHMTKEKEKYEKEASMWHKKFMNVRKELDERLCEIADSKYNAQIADLTNDE